MTETTSLNEGVDTKTSENKSAGLASLKMTQLQQLASQLGITGGSRMRKADLVKAIGEHQRGGSVAAKEAKAAKSEAAPAAEQQPTETKARSRRAPKTHRQQKLKLHHRRSQLPKQRTTRPQDRSLHAPVAHRVE
ncbi:Rho termination factor N-terminal domain-containing protein [Glutamicibacter sp. M10]|uniref:Rho termination factor N-terminal domain-containing protein n=1 Tax=Glutamicibacter sp. M10 TaxID=3023076 RepID=UPI0021C65C4C|nr:Rho termination factor N-terminal domain-containing protein [Glutamicibacter sp. M10]UXN31426.1 Rho termination factor N-terminal domain-containing protein [Glutamicibacter sp. M10]